MAHSTRSSLSVKELVTLLEKPKRKSTKRMREPLVDRDEIKKNMKMKWKGLLFFYHRSRIL